MGMTMRMTQSAFQKGLSKTSTSAAITGYLRPNPSVHRKVRVGFGLRDDIILESMPDEDMERHPSVLRHECTRPPSCHVRYS